MEPLIDPNLEFNKEAISLVNMASEEFLNSFIVDIEERCNEKIE